MIKGQKTLKGSLAKMGSKNPMFGKLKEKPGNTALHLYMHKRMKSSGVCEHCKEEKKVELSSKKHVYTRNPKDWQWLCKKCHHKYDGADKYLELGRYRKGKWYKKKCLNCKIEINVPKRLMERKKYCSRKCLMLQMWKTNKINHI